MAVAGPAQQLPIGVPSQGGSANAPTIPIAGVPNTGTPGVTGTSATNTTNPLPTWVAVNPLSSGITVPGGISSGLSTKDGSNTLVGDFKDTYGAGTGAALAGTSATLGTSTDSAVQATNNHILNAAARQGANISSGLAAAGISADSSTSALSIGDFNAQVTDTLANTDAQIELSQQNTLISALQDEGGAHGTDPSTLDAVMNGFSDAAQIASSIGKLGASVTHPGVTP